MGANRNQVDNPFMHNASGMDNLRLEVDAMVSFGGER
jgi:hypothetical protein